jgi:2-hydroxy-6-oxonona-2,4-dienedioate hydrolase
MRTKHWTIVITAGALAGLIAGRLLRRRSACRSGRFERRWVRVGGLDVHARVSLDPVPSEHTPVVLVHGLGMSSRYMMPIARCLAPDFRVHAPDLPGFGASDKPPHILTVPELADALAAFMDAMGLRRAAFLGNSLGCEILVEFALRHPRRVERLVLQGPTPDPKDCSALQQVLLFFVTGLFERWSLGWVAVSDYARSGVRRYAYTFQDMIANRIEPKLPQVQAPTLVVWGTRDYIISYRSIARMARLLPKGGLAVVPGAAHGMNYSHPRALRHAILPFLMQPPGAAGAAELRDG